MATPNPLQDNILCAGMTAAELTELAGACGEQAIGAGHVVLAAGDQQRRLYFLLNGTVQIELETPRAGDRVLAELSAGSVFGESSFFHSALHSATVRAVTDVTLLGLDRGRYEQLREARSSAALLLAANAADLLSARLQQTDHFIIELLEAQQDVKNHAAWKKFREKLSHHFSSAKGVVAPGGMALGD
ncbi:MAG: cyclic nucleotide-binding domain-containing protein [Pirellulaceae bacterium]|nr:cyclic nucleotide-binding domain-containing protein [Pirellulaceae bacterium]